MATQLAQNEFISNSALQAAESAVASKPPPVADATAAPISVSDGVPLPPSETEGAACVTAASSDNIDHIHEIFHHARRLLAEDDRRAEDFVDWQTLEAALEEPLPLFIRDGEHLKRWS